MTEVTIVPYTALWPGDPAWDGELDPGHYNPLSWDWVCDGKYNPRQYDYLSWFSGHEENLRAVSVFVIPNYWQLYTPEEMAWCAECLG